MYSLRNTLSLSSHLEFTSEQRINFRGRFKIRSKRNIVNSICSLDKLVVKRLHLSSWSTPNYSNPFFHSHWYRIANTQMTLQSGAIMVILLWATLLMTQHDIGIQVYSFSPHVSCDFAFPTSTNITSFLVPPVATLIVYRIKGAMWPVEVKMAGVLVVERYIIWKIFAIL